MDKNIKIIIGVVIAIAVIAVGYGIYKKSNQPVSVETVSNEPVEEDVIKIGVIAPLTGNAAELGEYIQRGLMLSNEDLDNKYSLIFEDSKCSDTKLVLSAAQKLTNIDKVKYIIGPLCAPAYQAVSGLFNQNNIAFMHTSAVTQPFIDSSGDFGIPGISTSLDQEDAYLANFIYKNLGIKKMAVFVWNEEWAVEHQKGFIDSFTNLGGQIVFNEKFSLDDKDFRTQILKLKQSDAQGIFVVALNFQNGNIVKQIRELNSDIKIFGQFEIEDPVFLKHSGNASNGVMYVYPKIDKNRKETANFIKNYQSKYKLAPNYYAYIGYDSLKLYDWAISQCQNNDSKCVIKKILAAKDFPGVSGFMTFDSEKNLSREFMIKKIENNKFVEIE